MYRKYVKRLIPTQDQGKKDKERCFRRTRKNRFKK